MKLGNTAHCSTEESSDNIAVQVLYIVKVLKTMPRNQLNGSLMTGAADLLAPSPL